MQKITFRICDIVSRETVSSSMLNKIANCANKAHADLLNHFYGSWESEGYKVESQNDRLCLTWNLIWASLGAVIIAEQETTKFVTTRASEVIIKWNLARFTSQQRLVDSNYEHNSHARF